MGSEQDCIFCRIASGDLDTDFVLETDNVVAFNDIAPAAPTHVLVVSKRHLGSVAELGPGEQELLAELIDAANAVAREPGVDESRGRRRTDSAAPSFPCIGRGCVESPGIGGAPLGEHHG
jgi:histidine triad (HIT) family protein